MKYELKNGWTKDIDKEIVFKFSEGYKDFLTQCKTERECVAETIRLAEECGFKPLESFDTLKEGDKIYAVNKLRSVMLAVIGSEKISDGVNIVGAHVDAPRLDLKPNPLYEDGELAYFKTHYYGGIKKYQWGTIPLALHGVVITKDGKSVDVRIGDENDDVTFVITDLLPHLAQEQMKKTPSTVIEAEQLNLLIGSMPVDGEEKEAVKANILAILNEKYGICEEDFLSAELQIVPAANAKDVGFDRSLIGSYAHDDRVCAYPSLMAILTTEACDKTAVCILTDKEEVGSMGNTGAKSDFMKLILLEMMDKAQEGATELNLLRCLDKSYCLSADVNAAFDPNFPSPYEKNNSARVNYGVAIAKYTGSRGKGGSSDASAELMSKIRTLFNENEVLWHVAELGKVEAGGGGTIAQYVANLGVETVDCGVPVLSMHAPFEVVAKLDVYMAYKAFHAFYND
ncbi:MAG: aminopeptidase [Ruminococcaceae bacterium]|nr:aminopeptidase [Oscillospiraceae bacterium]